MKTINRTALAMLLGILASPAAAGPAGQPADLILYHGRVFTAESPTAFAEAIAIRAEKIAAVGTSDEIAALAGERTRRVDLQGRVVVPGFNDAHAHFSPVPAGVTLRFDTLEPSWDEVFAALASAVTTAEPDTWIFGTVGRTVVLNEAVMRAALDRIAPRHPVLLRAFYGHGYVVSSKAMSALGIAEDEPDPMGGYYERMPGSQEINGRMWEYAGWNHDFTLATRVPDAAAIESLRRMADEAVRFGITSMQIFPTMPAARFVRLLVEADLPIRVRVMRMPPTSYSGRDFSDLRHIPGAAPNVTVSGIKWILDGTPIEHGAAMRRPYADAPDRRGALNFPESEIAAMVDESLALDEPLLLHCAGDRAAEVVLDVLEKRPRVDWKSKRVRIEHGDGVYGDLLERARKLGVIVVQNPSHFDRDLVGDRFAADTQFFPLRSWIEAGVPIALGSDGPMNPFLNIMLASIHPMRPAEAITRAQAVQAYTAGSAFAELAEREKGTLSVGKRADFAVLSGDLFAVPAPELPALTSVMTVVDGRIVYEAATARGDGCGTLTHDAGTEVACGQEVSQ